MITIPVIETERLILRQPQPDDLPHYARYGTGPRAHLIGGPFDEVNIFTHFCALMGHWDMRGFGRFVICLKSNNEPIGHAGPLMALDNVPPELSWTIWKDEYLRQGYAFEAARACVEHIFIKLNWPLAIALIRPENTESKALALKLGGTLNPSRILPDVFDGSNVFDFDKGCLDV